MGNQVQNSLPICQLSRLQLTVNRLYPQNGINRRQSNVAFWMDTLCVPVQDEYEAYCKQAIAQMRGIYQRADAVLVLDNWHQGISRSVNITEKTVRMYLANWQRSLQEGVWPNVSLSGSKMGDRI